MCSLSLFKSRIPILGKFGPNNKNCQFKQNLCTRTNSNMQSPRWYPLFCFDWDNIFWLNLFQKVKIVKLSWDLTPTLIQIFRIQWWCSLSLFLDPSYPFKLKFSTWTNSNKQKSMVKFTFSVLNLKYRFWANFVQKWELLI